MAHKKGVGSSDNGRDSNSKRLGIKLFGSQFAKAGNIILKQRGTKFHPGENVYLSRDHSIHAKVDGFVDFKIGRKKRTIVNIIPVTNELIEAANKQVEERVAEVPKQANVKQSANTEKDDLTKVEGIGPKLRDIFHESGILTFADLSLKDPEELRNILLEAGGKGYARFNPETWPAQAKLAAEGKWDELLKWQDELDGGRE